MMVDEKSKETKMARFLKNLKKMPGKDSPKQSYPPCNRAFTLRMMNPMSYHEGHTSPLDREIQPLLKRSIAKTHDSRKNSVENGSICSDISTQDNGLYDIHESDAHSCRNGSQKSSRDNKNKTPRKSVGRNNFMVRSHSSADGFDSLSNTNFNRNSATRSTLPLRLRSKSASAKTVTKSNGSKKSNEIDDETVSDTAMLKRTRSLCERPKSCNGYIRSSAPLKNSKSTSNTSRNSSRTYGNVRSNDAKVKLDLTSSPAMFVGKQQKRVRQRDDYLDSDSTISEVDGYRPPGRANQRSLSNHTGSGAESSLESSFDSALPSSSLSVSFGASDALNYLSKIREDDFHKKITDICNLISEKHPGDFQILESLIEMQHAYEERNNLVNDAISSLQRQNNRLQNKVNESVDMMQLAKPLMQATKSFERQLQQIMHSKDVYKQKIERSCQAPEIEEKQKSPLEEITSEAIDVANKIEQLMLLKSPETNVEKDPFTANGLAEIEVEKIDKENFENLTNGEVIKHTVTEC